MGKRSIKIQLNPDSRLPLSEDTPQRVDFRVQYPTFEDFRVFNPKSIKFQWLPIGTDPRGGVPLDPPLWGVGFCANRPKTNTKSH
jgi:hypothetical protein